MKAMTMAAAFAVNLKNKDAGNEVFKLNDSWHDISNFLILGEKPYESDEMKGGIPRLVEFYSDNCMTCKRMEDSW